ncbi:MAG: hypothetical protein Q9M25_03635 [Mariprofundaceae bacterium]|nr:hypothetical protein [Mariprofundaceae bacterium]
MFQKKLKRPDFNTIAYIRVVQFAVFQAENYKISIDGTAKDGFTYDELRAGEGINEIDESWLKKTLIQSCNVYLKGNDEPRGTPTVVDVEADGTRFVIKSDEFMRFASLVGHEKATRSLQFVSIGLIISILLLLFSVYKVFICK